MELIHTFEYNIKNTAKMSEIKKLQSKVNSLKPGESLTLSTSRIGTIKSVERSGKGDKLRFVTTFKNGSFEVLSTISF